MDKVKIQELLSDHNAEQVEKFASYCDALSKAKDKKTRKLKNPWMPHKTNEQLATLFRRVKEDGLVFDGERVTLLSTGISYSYVAYKNKMLLSYPESQVDVSLVFKGDDFSFSKKSGKVIYSHNIMCPFKQNDMDIIGGYCVIRNKRGEFLTTLSVKDIEKHRKVAKTDYIWKNWFKEMALKTVIKKACKQHFADIYQNIEINDNENYDLENPVDLELKHKQEFEAIETLDDLKEYYLKNKGVGKDFDKAVMNRKNQLTNNQ